MLISLVNLLLQNLLPLLIFISLFNTLSSPIASSVKVLAVLGGAAMAVGILLLNTHTSLAMLSVEHVRLVLLVLFYLFSLIWWYQGYRTPVKSTVSGLILILVMSTLCLFPMVLHLSAIWSLEGSIIPLLVGLTLGAGISISLALILQMLASWCWKNGWILLVQGAYMMFMAGQLTAMADLLAQFDLIPALFPLWDSSHLLSNQSESGYILHALLGYDATPTLWQALIYLISCICLIPVHFLAAHTTDTEGKPQ